LIIDVFPCHVSGQDILHSEEIPRDKVLKPIDQRNNHGFHLLIAAMVSGHQEEICLLQDSASILQKGILKENFLCMAKSKMSVLYEINGMFHCLLSEGV
jgi:hypothetical protein